MTRAFLHNLERDQPIGRTCERVGERRCVAACCLMQWACAASILARLRSRCSLSVSFSEWPNLAETRPFTRATTNAHRRPRATRRLTFSPIPTNGRGSEHRMKLYLRLSNDAPAASRGQIAMSACGLVDDHRRFANRGVAAIRTEPYATGSVVLPRGYLALAGASRERTWQLGAWMQAREQEPVGVGVVAGLSLRLKFIESSRGAQPACLSEVFRLKCRYTVLYVVAYNY